ncbi:unnamed protein product [Tilletia laevis]|uniref:Fe2OG dioxygenase domain-containing protein n=2 Tax=Tilletia TaxID=13289 RepID=A0A177TGG2_9BASI|nr:hypothetical protein CF336_g7707 [Tilletia laevis]KAE8245635.1 hypothetical protein A4X03_0g7465 [Tilletia caries]KAE8187388.1 hypothetical protein CF335_g7189 [Tilletia laevis]CAD6892240.1 unnamed protein product [Tilletia caries]CAD6903996.1 unnamed protein product [Tilletia laevis]
MPWGWGYGGYESEQESRPSTVIDDGGSDVKYGDGEDSDIGEDEGPLFDLGKALASGNSETSEFSFGGSADFLPSAPGLIIEGVGKVALPLVSAQEAEKIVKMCEQAPFGRGFDTLVDTKVRNSWQLDPSKIRLTNPGWTEGIQRAAPLIAEKFGVAGTPITLHLYKFLLYKEGGHFAKHRDTEKEDRMFATMVVQLPSAHKGGQLQVFKDGAKDPVIHDFGAAAGTAEFQCNYAVHYADAEHAVQPVTEGYRLALVYSVCWPANRKQPAPSLSRDNQAPMIRALAQLADDNREFHYYLEHSYTPKSISELGVGSLKGQDRARVASLRTMNDVLPSHQRFNFYLVHGERQASYYGTDQTTYQCEWEETDPPTYSFTPLLSLDGKSLTSKPIDLDDADVLNPDYKTRMQRWSGHRIKTYEGYLGNEGPTKDTKYEKYLLLAWPAKLVEDKMLVLTGLKVHFSTMLSTGASPDAVRKFVQRVARMKTTGQIKADKETKFGQALYIQIASVPKLHDLLPVYFDIFPHGTHVPKNTPVRDTYLYTFESSTTTPFIDIIQLAQHPRYWKSLEDKIVNSFAGQVLHTLELMEEVKASVALKMEVKDQLVNKLLGHLRGPIPAKPESYAGGPLQEKLWSAVLASEGSESFGDLARTYIAYFPQGGYARTHSAGKQQFEDLLRLATSTSVWDSISSTVLKTFEGNLASALMFVKLSKERSLPRTVWAPFLDMALKMCEASKHVNAVEISPNFYEFVPKYLLLKAMWDAAIVLDSKTEDSKSDSDAAARLLTRYIAMAPMGIASLGSPYHKLSDNEEFADLIQLARKFPSVWEASKSKVLGAMGDADMKQSLLFIKQCWTANLPQSVWGPSVDICTRVVAPPTQAELSDEKLQTTLWRVAIDLSTSALCETSVKRYLATPLAEATKACSALMAVCKADSRAFKSKRAVLEPLLLHWFRSVEKDLQAVQKKCTEANGWKASSATITGHPSLAKFAKSSKTSTKIEGFSGIVAARSCAKNIVFKNCGGTAVAEGRGKKAYVLVTKQTDYAKQLDSEREQVKARHDALQELLSQSEADEGEPAVKKQKTK